MPLIAKALRVPYDPSFAQQCMGPAYLDWLVRLYVEDFDARGVHAALARLNLLPAAGHQLYLTASLQEALLLPTGRDNPSIAVEWTTPSSDHQLPQTALLGLGGVPPSYLPPYVFGTLAAWARFVDKPSPAWFTTDWLHASDVEFPPPMRAWWPGFLAC